MPDRWHPKALAKGLLLAVLAPVLFIVLLAAWLAVMSFRLRGAQASSS